MTSTIATARRVVVKIGSSSVTADGRGLDHGAIDSWARQIAALRAGGKQVLLVSSGVLAGAICIDSVGCLYSSDGGISIDNSQTVTVTTGK